MRTGQFHDEATSEQDFNDFCDMKGEVWDNGDSDVQVVFWVSEVKKITVLCS